MSRMSKADPLKDPVLKETFDQITRTRGYVANILASLGHAPAPGASTTITTDLAAKAPADGYTLLMMTDNHVTNPSLFRKLPYDSERVFAPITLAALAPFLLVVHPSVAVSSVKELIGVASASRSIPVAVLRICRLTPRSRCLSASASRQPM